MISVIGIMRFTTLLNIGLNDKNRQSKRYAKNTQEYVRRVTARGQRLKREAGIVRGSVDGLVKEP